MSGIRVAMVLALVALATASGVWDAFASPAPTPGEAAGPLVSSARPGSAVIHADGLTPGSARSGSLTLSNEGDAVTLTLRTTVRDVAGPRGGRLSDALVVEIRDGTRVTPGRLIWSGRLVDGAVVAQVPLPANASRTLALTARLPRDAGDEVQGAAAAFDLHWEG